MRQFLFYVQTQVFSDLRRRLDQGIFDGKLRINPPKNSHWRTGNAEPQSGIFQVGSQTMTVDQVMELQTRSTDITTGVLMHRLLTLIAVSALLTGVLQAQVRFTINAASGDPVAGWQKMDIDGRSVWVNPAPATDFSRHPRRGAGTDRNFGNYVKVAFTDAGARKMRDLTTAQMNKLIAMVLDGKSFRRRVSDP
jgi:hypothetical protein